MEPFLGTALAWAIAFAIVALAKWLVQRGFNTVSKKPDEIGIRPQKEDSTSPKRHIDRDIKIAWVLATLVGAGWLVIILFGRGFLLKFVPPNLQSLSLWDLINVPIIWALGFGVYKRSRVFALLLTTFAALAVVGEIVERKSGSPVGASIFYLFFFIRGTIAVFRYHKLRANSETADSVSGPQVTPSKVPDSSRQSSAAMPHIYLRYADQNHGPYVLDQVRSMWGSGIITADAMYRTESETEWTPITNLLAPEYSQRVQHIESPLMGIPSQGGATEPVPVQSEKADHLNASNPRPWRRLWARFLDLAIISTPPMVIASLFFSPTWGLFALMFVFVVAWMAETTLLSKWGTTPGKWLLGVLVREADGQKLSFVHAQQRTLSVIVRTGIFWLPLFGILAYRDLERKGATKWDRKGRYIVTYTPVSGARWFASLSLVFVFIAATVIGLGDLISQDQRISSPKLVAPVSAEAVIAFSTKKPDANFQAYRETFERRGFSTAVKAPWAYLGRYFDNADGYAALGYAYFVLSLLGMVAGVLMDRGLRKQELLDSRGIRRAFAE